MKTEIIAGHEIEYNFFDGTNREMNDIDIDHVRSLVVEGFVAGELNQYDHETEEEIRGWWKKV